MGVTPRMIGRVFVLLLSVLVAPSLGYQKFQDDIPNGDQIPHPCKPNLLWQGVGHLLPGGGGTRNSFGMDFYKNGMKWDRCLCETDSDRDGKTNGEELGDPGCTWTMGTVPQRTTGLSHPGVCQPLDDPICQIHNKDFGAVCEGGEERNPCIDELLKQDGMQVWDALYPETPVPAQETTYMCQTFEFPDTTTDYHAVGFYPKIDNKHVMHHMLLYGCSDDSNVTSTPAQCEMAELGCNDLIFAWGVGFNGNCLNTEFGFRFGLNGYKKFALQSHWNNPQLETHHTDSSGVVVLYTPNMRPNDGGMVMIGQQYLNIPPNRRDFKVEATCTAECTSAFSDPIYISQSMIHMHYLGNKGYIYHNRNGTTINGLVVQDDYSYDTPITFSHPEPIEFLPGDELHTICHFKSTSRSKRTYWGEGTQDEMCYGFLTYYPVMPQWRGCVQYMSYPPCHIQNDTTEYCDWDAFWLNATELIAGGYQNCDVTGETCLPSCRSYLESWAAYKPLCMTGDAFIIFKGTLAEYVSEESHRIFASCDDKPDEDNWTKPDGPGEGGTGEGEGGLCSDGGWQYPRPSGANSPVVSIVLLVVTTLLMG